MTQQEPTAHADLSRLHREWEELHARLRVREQVLSDALALYAKGKGPRPDSLIQEVGTMRTECSARFNRLMAAVRGDRAPGAQP